MPRGKGGKRKKRRTQSRDALDIRDDAPHSMIVGRGKLGKGAMALVDDLRKVFSPYTATKLKEKRSNTIQDFLGACGPLKVTHLVTVTQKNKGPNIRIGRTVSGPTLSFHVEQYALSSHIRERSKKYIDSSISFQTPPLVVLNNFDMKSAPHQVKIIALTFQAMFPPINVQTVKLADCRRILLLHYVSENDLVEFRHYLIKTAPTGTSKAIRKLIRSKNPSLKNKDDIADLFNNDDQGYATSDSEYEDEEAQVELPTRNDKLKKFSIPSSIRNALSKKKLNEVNENNNNEQDEMQVEEEQEDTLKSVVKLYEIGPRMTIKLAKVQTGVFDGEVQYHAFKTKDEAEKERLKALHAEKKKLKEERKKQQEENVGKKRQLEEEKETTKQAKRDRRNAKRVKFSEEAEDDADNEDNNDDDDDE